MKRLASGLVVSVAVAALAALPTVANATPVSAETTSSCVVDSAQLDWGIKESFRSYISGSIANGEWTTSDEMTYETPAFIWTESEGEVASDLTSGSIAYTGAVSFTGHEGALQFDLADPAIEFESPDTGYLSVAIGATDEADAGGAVESDLVRVAKLDLGGSLEASGTDLSINGAVPVLTAEGATAFNGEYGSYVSGDELDPIALTATVNGCELLEQETAAPEVTPEPTQEAVPISAPEQNVPWIPIIIGAVALLVIGVAGGMLIAGRKKGTADGPEEPGADDTP